MCDFPYLLKNGTCIKYSDELNSEYISIQIIFLFLSSLGILLNSGIFYYYYKRKMYRYQYLGLTFSNFFIMLDFIDPFGYGDIIPYPLEVLLSDMATWISLAIFGMLVLTLTNINFELEDKKYKKYTKIYIIISFTLNLILSLLQGFHSRVIWRGTKLILLGLFELGLAIILNYFIRNSILFSRNNISMMTRLYYKTTIFNFIISSIISFQIYIGINSFNERLEPKINFNNLILPIFQLIGNYYTTYIFHKKQINNYVEHNEQNEITV